MKNKKVLIGVVVAAVVVAGVVACAPKPNTNYVGNPTPNVQKADVTPEVDKFGIVKAEQWAEAYPYEYASYLENATNTPPKEDYLSGQYAALGYPAGLGDCTSALPEGWEYVDAGKLDYLITNPEIKVLGLGYGYAKYYTEPASHVFSLWTVAHNGRVGDGSKTKAACISCKSPQWSYYVRTHGDGVNLLGFNDVIGEFDENISCASCHGNDPMTLAVARVEWERAMGADGKVASLEGQVCGQCHCDYSMAPGTSIPTSPYDNGRPDMLPEKSLQWYDDHEFVDWTYASTGAKMLAIRHAEYEFNYGGTGSHMIQLGYDCNDCHMATKVAADGTVYTDHHWINPTDNDELIARDCSKCHKDLKAEVKAIQEATEAKTVALGKRCEQFIRNFEDALAAGTLTEEQIARLQWIQRASCFYWNLAAAENSEGAHNPAYYENCFDLGNKVLDEGDRIIGKTSKVS